MNRMPQTILACLLVALFVGGSMPVNADQEAPRVIGAYERMGFDGDLTERDVEATDHGLVVDSPAFSSELRVDQSYLTENLGDFAANRAFHIQGGDVVLPGEDTTFFPFEPSTQPVFTKGSKVSIQLADRPMWVSVERNGDAVTLDLDDGDTSGQDLYISKEWLRGQGMHRPIATHEDGYDLAVRSSADQRGFIIEVPHFTQLILTPADIDVKGRQGGAPFPHAGTVTWDTTANELSINVALKLSDYELLVEKDWFDLNMGNMSLINYSWTIEDIDSASYYVVAIPSEDTPTSVEFSPFAPDGLKRFGLGKFETVHSRTPLYMQIAAQVGRIDVSFEASSAAASNGTGLKLNTTWIQATGIEQAEILLNGSPVLSYSVADGLLVINVVPSVGEISLVESTVDTVNTLAMSSLNCLDALNPRALNLHTKSGYSGSEMALYVYHTEFCIDWSLANGPEGATGHFTVAWSIVDEATGAGTGDNRWGSSSDGTDVERARVGFAIVEWETGVAFPERITWAAHAWAWYDVPDEFVDPIQGMGGWECAATLVAFGATVVVGSIVAVVGATGGALGPCVEVFWGNFDKLFCEVLDAEEQFSYRCGDEIVERGPLVIVMPRASVNADIADPGQRRADTWDFIEDATYPRPDDWDGRHTVSWEVEFVEFPELTYTADQSRIGDISYDDATFDANFVSGTSTFNIVPKDDDVTSFPSNQIITKQAGNDALDWEAPPSTCMPMKAIHSVTGPYEHMIALVPASPGSCIVLDDSVAQSQPVMSVLVGNSTLPSSELAAGLVSITRDDILAEGGNITRALALKMTTNTTFVDGIYRVESPDPPPEGPACSVGQQIYSSLFSTTVDYVTLVGPAAAHAETTTWAFDICFELLPGITMTYAG